MLLFLVLILIACNSPDLSAPPKETEALWTKLNVAPPTMQVEYRMIHDQVNDRLITYGGRDPEFRACNETWSYQLTNQEWIQLTPGQSPPWRVNHSMVYDPEHHIALLFGGNNFDHVFDDVWIFDLATNQWSQQPHQTARPPARQMHGMVYIPSLDKFMLFGGRRLNGGPAFHDTWYYDLESNKWVPLEITNHPGNQDHVNLAYDSQQELVLLFTSNESSGQSQLWAFDPTGSNWFLLNTAMIPQSSHGNLTYIPGLDQSLYFGNSPPGSTMKAHLFNYATLTWTPVGPEFPGSYIEHGDMVYVTDKDLFIQYGGCCASDSWQMKIITEP